MQTVMRVSKVDQSQGRIVFQPVPEKDGGERAGELWLQGVGADKLAGMKVGDVVTVTIAAKPMK